MSKVNFYIVTEKEIYDDGSEDSHSFLSDSQPDNYEREYYSITSRPAKREEITLEMIVSTIESDMEGGNYHDEIFLPGWFSEVLLRHLPKEKVTEIFLEMIEEKGTIWRE